MGLRRPFFAFLLAFLAMAPGTLDAIPGAGEVVFINEIHYDNTGTDQGEGVEIAGPAGTDLRGYRLVFYNGNNRQVYADRPLQGVIDDEGDGAGTVWIPVGGVQNGSPDAVALVDDAKGRLVQFLSYEGTFTAVGGAADGERATDIGVAESGTTAVGHSLQLVGSGSEAGAFSWRGASAASPGRLNVGQTLEGVAVGRVTLVFRDERLAEAGGADGWTEGVVTVSPPPAEPVDVVLSARPAGQVALPDSVQVGLSGAASFPVRSVIDGVRDGGQRVVVTAFDRSGATLPGAGSLTVDDADALDLRAGTIRVATYNIENGARDPGTAKHAALRDVLSRVGPDVVAFQEVSGLRGFADIEDLVGSLGFGLTREFLAVEGDAFNGSAPVNGGFGGDQFPVLASRFPIAETVQVGRGEPGNEMTRYPLFVAVAPPGAGGRLFYFVVVHYKAGSGQADRFRKAVEGFRTVRFLQERGLDGGEDRVIVLGDFNEDDGDIQPAAFDTGIDTATHIFGDGSAFSFTYQLAPDLRGVNSRTLAYAQFPGDVFRAVGLVTPPAVQLDGEDRTRTNLSPRKLDYILVPESAGADGTVATEVYNSLLDGASPGLPKAGAAPRGRTSRSASDHQLVFADIPLAPRPKLGLAFNVASVAEEAGGQAEATLTITRPSGDGGAEQVFLTWSPWGVLVPEAHHVSFAAGETVKSVVVRVVADGEPGPDRTVVAAASAPGYSTAYARLAVRNFEAEGAVLITQYHEPSDGSAMRALEVMNNTGGVIDFAERPLEVRVFANGQTEPRSVAVLREGILRAGEVVVFGDARVGAYLLSEGLVERPERDFSEAFDGTAYTDAQGDTALVKVRFAFTGDDALDVVLGGVRGDVFGDVGHDPGSAWAGGGVQTRDANLGRRRSASQGSSGWRDPGLRFETVAAGGDLAGFGVAPALDDPYANWVSEARIKGPAAGRGFDVDGDGMTNFQEFVFGGDPAVAEEAGIAPVPDFTAGPAIMRYRRRSAAAGFLFAVERSDDAAHWEVVDVEESVRANDDGTETVTIAIPPPPEGVETALLQQFLRVRATQL